GAPKIPSNWHSRIRFDGEITWSEDKNDTIGHVSKRIDIESTYKREDDYYRFKQIKGLSRHLLISTYYTNNDHPDSIIYYYYPENNGGHNISRQQADSLLTAEKIEKDY